MTAQLYNAHDGEHHAIGGNNYWFQVMNNDWTIFTANAVGQMSPPLHFHTETDEIIVVTKGEFAFVLDGEYSRGVPGTIVFIPRMVNHTFVALEDGSEAIGIFNPGGIDGYFKDMHEMISKNGGQPPSPEMVASLSDKYDFTVVGAPLIRSEVQKEFNV